MAEPVAEISGNRKDIVQPPMPMLPSQNFSGMVGSLMGERSGSKNKNSKKGSATMESRLDYAVSFFFLFCPIILFEFCLCNIV